MAADDSRKRKITGILNYTKDYLVARFEHAGRINPTMRRIADDLMWHELETVRQVLSESKGFGPDRIIVVDILTSFDKRKKQALFSPTDQNTLFTEIISEAEKDTTKKKMEGQVIVDIGEFYQAIDPSLQDAVKLIQTVIWWDFRDAIDLYMLDQQIERLTSLQKQELTPQIISYFKNQMEDPPDELGREDILKFEGERSLEAGQAFLSRREAEPGYRMIVKRRPTGDDAFEKALINLAPRAKVLQQLQNGQDLDENLRKHYSKQLHIAPEEVTVERVVRLEREALASGKRLLEKIFDSNTTAGEPYDYKASQIPGVKSKMQRIKEIAGLEQKAEAAAG